MRSATPEEYTETIKSKKLISSDIGIDQARDKLTKNRTIKPGVKYPSNIPNPSSSRSMPSTPNVYQSCCF